MVEDEMKREALRSKPAWVVAVTLGVFFILGMVVLFQQIMSEKAQVAKLREELANEGEQVEEVTTRAKGKIKALSEEMESLLANEHQEEQEFKKRVEQQIVELKRQNLSYKHALIASLDTTQDVFAMKLAVNNPVLADLENHSGRSMEICNRWNELLIALEDEGGFSREVALLKLRIVQAYCAAGLLDKVKLDEIDWAAAGLEHKQAGISARIYYAMASQSHAKGDLAAAKKYLSLCRDEALKMREGSADRLYVEASIHMIEGGVIVSSQPREAMDHYLKAIEKLKLVVAAMPGNVVLRSRLAKACLDGSLLLPGGDSAGNGMALRKEAHAQAFWLAERHPELKLAHEVRAHLDLAMAEEQLRNGEEGAVKPLLQRAEDAVKQAGGDVVLSAGIAGVRAFILWDGGQRSEAHVMINLEIEKMRNYTSQHPHAADAYFRLAELLWERSSMQLDPHDAVKDGRAAAEVLVHLIKRGAGLYETSSRRMIAIIFGDIGHLAESKGQKELAKQYFQQALGQWRYLSDKWGDNDEYTEGKRWCQWRLRGE